MASLRYRTPLVLPRFFPVFIVFVLPTPPPPADPPLLLRWSSFFFRGVRDWGGAGGSIVFSRLSLPALGDNAMARVIGSSSV